MDFIENIDYYTNIANERATETCGEIIGKSIFDVEPKLQAVIKYFN